MATGEQGVRGLIESLRDGLEGGSLGFDEEGRAALDAGGGLLIGIDHLPNTGQLLLHAELGELPAGADAVPLCRDLLHANLDQELPGAALGLDRDSGTVALFARRGLDTLDPEALGLWVSDFADAAQPWIDRLAGGEEPDLT